MSAARESLLPYRPSRELREDIRAAELRLAELRRQLEHAERQESIWAEEEYL